jgi:hypothetical protein
LGELGEERFKQHAPKPFFLRKFCFFIFLLKWVFLNKNSEKKLGFGLKDPKKSITFLKKVFSIT